MNKEKLINSLENLENTQVHVPLKYYRHYIGSLASQEIKEVSVGFDHNKGKIFLNTEKELMLSPKAMEEEFVSEIIDYMDMKNDKSAIYNEIYVNGFLGELRVLKERVNNLDIDNISMTQIRLINDILDQTVELDYD